MAAEGALREGAEASVSLLVAPQHTARAVQSGSVDVFATPELIRLLEMAACKALEGRLDAGATSVGSHVDVKHLAPTPVGATVTARAVLTRVDKRTLTFAVDARDERERVAEGTHTRVIVDAARFAKKAADKLAAQ